MEFGTGFYKIKKEKEKSNILINSFVHSGIYIFVYVCVCVCDHLMSYLYILRLLKRDKKINLLRSLNVSISSTFS